MNEDLIRKVRAMRAAQIAFFKTRSPQALKEAKFFETQVDLLLAALADPNQVEQIKMF